MILDLDENKFYSKVLNLWFPVTFSNAATGFPPNTRFDESNFIRPSPVNNASQHSLPAVPQGPQDVLDLFRSKE